MLKNKYIIDIKIFMKTTNNYASIAKNKSLLKEFSNSKFSRIVYLNDNDEFQIQIFNPEKHTIGVQISLNDIGMSNMLVLKPSERVWLERYLDTAKKFKFSTYEIDNSEEAKNATEYNGLIKISFYNEITKRPSITLDDYKPKVWYCYDHSDSNTWLNKNLNTTITCDAVTSALSTANYTSTTGGFVPEISSSLTANCSIETGRIEEGSRSNQTFEYVNNEFQSYPFRTETIKIMPKSTKPVSVNDLQKIYCCQCGRKL